MLYHFLNFEEFEICTFSKLFLFSMLKHPYSEYGTSYMSYHQQLSRILLQERRECKKADVFLGKFLLITSAGKIFKVPSILLFEPGMLLPFVMLGLLINSHLLPLRKIGELLEILFPLPFFISWQKLMPFKKKCHFSIPIFKELFQRKRTHCA